MDASESLSCENNNSSLFSAVPDSSIMYQNKDSNLISDLIGYNLISFGLFFGFFTPYIHPLNVYWGNVCIGLFSINGIKFIHMQSDLGRF